MAANWPGAMASMVTGRAVVVVAFDASKFRRNSPFVAPVLDSVLKLGVVFS